MTHAYQEMYLSNAQALLGDAFDYAINACDISGNDFVKLFSVSSVSKRIENGEPAYLAGKSGIEVVEDILVETTGKAPTAKPQVTFSRSREYWIGCYRVLSMVLRQEIRRYFQGPFVRGFAADVRSASRSRHQQICRYRRFQNTCVFYRYQSQAHPYDLRLHTSRACQSKRRQPPVNSNVRAAQQGYQ